MPRHPAIVGVLGFYGRQNLGDEVSLQILKTYVSSNHWIIKTNATQNRLRSDLKLCLQASVIILGNGNIFQDKSSFRSFWYYLCLMVFLRLLGKPVVALSQGVGPLSKIHWAFLNLVTVGMVWVNRNGYDTSQAPKWARVIAGADWAELAPKLLDFDPQSPPITWQGFPTEHLHPVTKAVSGGPRLTTSLIVTDRFHGALLALRNNIPWQGSGGGEKRTLYLAAHQSRSIEQIRRLALRNATVLRWALRWAPTAQVPSKGILYSFNIQVLQNLWRRPARQSRIGIIDGISAKILPRFWSIPRTRGVDVVRDLIQRHAPSEMGLWGGDPLISVPFHRWSGFDKTVDTQFVIEDIRRRPIKVLFVALGSPRQEIESEKIYSRYPDLLIIPCGGALDAIFGSAPLVPVWVHKLGVEWMVRAFMQPARWQRLPKMIVGILQARKVMS